MVLDNKGARPEGKKDASDNLKQMAKVADAYVELNKNGLPGAVSLVKKDLGMWGEHYSLVVTLLTDQKIVVTIQEHEFDLFRRLFEEPPKKSGQFGQDECYTH